MDEAAQTATAGLVTLIPEGLVLLMSVTFAVAAVRLARKDTLVQQMSATESLAAVDTICVDKTGTLTDGELRLLGAEVADGLRAGGRPRGAGPLRRQRRRPQPHPGGDRRALPRRGGEGRRRGALLLGVEVERPADRLDQLRAGGARRAERQRGALTLPPGLAREARAGDRGRAARRRLRRIERAAARRARRGPRRRLAAVALVVLEETLRPDAAETVAFMREEDVDLKLISGDARATVTAVAQAVGVPQTPA